MQLQSVIRAIFPPLIFLLTYPANSQDLWKFIKEKDNVVAVNSGTGKSHLLFKGGETNTVEDGDSTTTDISYSIASFVGPYVTVLESNYSFTKGAAHDSRERIFKVLDVNTGKAVLLTDLFNEADILKALLQDSYIKGALNPGITPKTLSELVSNLNNTDLARFGDYMFGSFAFHHVEPGKVAVRMGLTYNYEAARGAFTQLGFFLPVPEKLKTPLALAVTNKTLMKDLLPKIPQLE